MNEPIDIRLIEGRERAEDMQRLAAGEVTPEQLQRENAIVQSAARLRNRGSTGAPSTRSAR